MVIGSREQSRDLLLVLLIGFTVDLTPINPWSLKFCGLDMSDLDHRKALTRNWSERDLRAGLGK